MAEIWIHIGGCGFSARDGHGREDRSWSADRTSATDDPSALRSELQLPVQDVPISTAGQVARQRKPIPGGRLEVGSDMPGTLGVSPTDTRLPASPDSSPVRADYRCTPSWFGMDWRKYHAPGCPRTNRETVAKGLAAPRVAGGPR